MFDETDQHFEGESPEAGITENQVLGYVKTQGMQEKKQRSHQKRLDKTNTRGGSCYGNKPRNDSFQNSGMPVISKVAEIQGKWYKRQRGERK